MLRSKYQNQTSEVKPYCLGSEGQPAVERLGIIHLQSLDPFGNSSFWDSHPVPHILSFMFQWVQWALFDVVRKFQTPFWDILIGYGHSNHWMFSSALATFPATWGIPMPSDALWSSLKQSPPFTRHHKADVARSYELQPSATGWWFGPPLWTIWKSIGMISNPIYGKIKNGNQTTNQATICNHLQPSATIQQPSSYPRSQQLWSGPSGW